MEEVRLEEKLVAATRDVFHTMVQLEVQPETAVQRTPHLGCAISGVLGLAGDLCGLLSIHCPETLALAATGNLLGIEIERVDDDVRDAIGEIANMIAGGVKSALAGDDMSLELSIPTTVTGCGYRVHSFSGARQLLIPFTTCCGRFWVELKYKIDS